MFYYCHEEKSVIPDNYQRTIEVNLIPFKFELYLKIKVGCKFKSGKIFTEEWANEVVKAVQKINCKYLSATFWNESLRLTISI